jgi:hypothetical protein
VLQSTLISKVLLHIRTTDLLLIAEFLTFSCSISMHYAQTHTSKYSRLLSIIFTPKASIQCCQRSSCVTFQTGTVRVQFGLIHSNFALGLDRCTIFNFLRTGVDWQIQQCDCWTISKPTGKRMFDSSYCEFRNMSLDLSLNCLK